MLALLLSRGLTSSATLAAVFGPPALTASVQVEAQARMLATFAAPQLTASVKTNLQNAVVDRLYVVAAEDRTWIVPNESRGISVR